MFLRYDTRNDVDDTLNNNLNAKVPGSVKLVVEGSGANTKYYIQNGADSASKKLLGSGNNFVVLKGNLLGADLSFKTTSTTAVVNGFTKIVVNEVSLTPVDGGQTQHESFIELGMNDGTGNRIIKRITSTNQPASIAKGTEYTIPSGECSVGFWVGCFKNKAVFDIKIVP